MSSLVFSLQNSPQSAWVRRICIWSIDGYDASSLDEHMLEFGDKHPKVDAFLPSLNARRVCSEEGGTADIAKLAPSYQPVIPKDMTYEVLLLLT